MRILAAWALFCINYPATWFRQFSLRATLINRDLLRANQLLCKLSNCQHTHDGCHRDIKCGNYPWAPWLLGTVGSFSQARPTSKDAHENIRIKRGILSLNFDLLPLTMRLQANRLTFLKLPHLPSGATAAHLIPRLWSGVDKYMLYPGPVMPASMTS